MEDIIIAKLATVSLTAVPKITALC